MKSHASTDYKAWLQLSSELYWSNDEWNHDYEAPQLIMFDAIFSLVQWFISACEVSERLLFIAEVVERIELIARLDRCIAGAFQQQIGWKSAIGQAMRRGLYGIAVVMLNVFVLHFNFNKLTTREGDRVGPVLARCYAPNV